MFRPETSEVHIRHCMLVFFDLGWNATKTTKTLKDLYGEVVTARRCQYWFQKFKSGNRSLIDEPRCGRPSNFDNEALKSLIESDPRQTIEELSLRLRSPWTTVQTHLKLIGYKMPQGKMKVKSKLPDNVKIKKNKGSAISKRSNAPIQPKKAKFEESHKLKKIISKTVNKKMEEEIRSRALDRKTTLSKAQEAMIAHNAAKTAAS